MTKLLQIYMNAAIYEIYINVVINAVINAVIDDVTYILRIVPDLDRMRAHISNLHSWIIGLVSAFCSDILYAGLVQLVAIDAAFLSFSCAVIAVINDECH